MTDGDRLLNLGGIAIGLLILAMIGVLAITFVEPPSGGTTGSPPTEWTAERVNQTHVRITHAGGESVPANRLVVYVEGYDRRVTWNGMISEGDSGVVRARRGQLVRLYWLTERGERIRLESWRT